MVFRTANVVDVEVVRARWEAARVRSADLRDEVRERDAFAKEVVTAMRDTYWISSNERWGRLEAAVASFCDFTNAQEDGRAFEGSRRQSLGLAKKILIEHLQDTDPRLEPYVEVPLPAPSDEFPIDAVDIQRLALDLEDIFESFEETSRLLTAHRHELTKRLKDAPRLMAGHSRKNSTTQRRWIMGLRQFLDDEGCLEALVIEQHHQPGAIVQSEPVTRANWSKWTWLLLAPIVVLALVVALGRF